MPAKSVDMTPAELTREVRSLQRQVTRIHSAVKAGGLIEDAQDGECILGNDPETCTAAKPYRYQKGCRAPACRAANSAYYNKGEDAPPAKANGVTKKLPVKAVAAPTKKVAAKKLAARPKKG